MKLKLTVEEAQLLKELLTHVRENTLNNDDPRLNILEDIREKLIN